MSYPVKQYAKDRFYKSLGQCYNRLNVYESVLKTSLEILLKYVYHNFKATRAHILLSKYIF